MTKDLHNEQFSVLVGNYRAKTKFENALLFLKNNWLGIDIDDLVFPFATIIYNTHSSIYGTFSKSVFEIKESEVYIKVNMLCCKEEYYDKIIEKKDFRIEVNNFDFSRALYSLFHKITNLDPQEYKLFFKIENIYCIEKILSKYVAQIDPNIQCTYKFYNHRDGNIHSMEFRLRRVLNPEINSIKNRLETLTMDVQTSSFKDSYELEFRKFFNPNNDLTDSEWNLLYNYVIDNNLLRITQLKDGYKLFSDMLDVQIIENDFTINVEKINCIPNINIKEILYKPIAHIDKFKNINFDNLANLIRLYNHCLRSITRYINIRHNQLTKINQILSNIKHFDKLEFEISTNEKQEFEELQKKFFNIFTRSNERVIKANHKINIFDFDEFKWTWNYNSSSIIFKSTLPCLSESKITIHNFKQHLKLLKIFGKLDKFYEQLTEYILLYS